MSSLIFLIPLALLLGGVALGAFFWSLKSGQYEDLDGAAERILFDDEEEGKDDRSRFNNID
ncbi:cbb3-type cytochrome oxidase assembly protein CcoS [Mesorhizobium sp. PUT5]|uniref:cbb3-type cytochrome oxidase assembly protein CcoS n=1 Tax=Mesorhizobium sp. PUT5 TaxID=3454629 RepID=UPI003FA4B332